MPRPRRHRKKALWLANLLGEGNDHPGAGILEQIGRVILEPEHRLVSGRDRAGDGDILRRQRRPHDARKSSALRDDDGAGRDPVPPSDLTREGERNPVRKIDDAEAIRPAQCHSGRACVGGDALLRRLPLAPGLAEAGGEYHGTAQAATGAGRDGVLDGDARQDSMAASTPSGRLSMARRQARSPMFVWFRLTRWMGPR